MAGDPTPSVEAALREIQELVSFGVMRVLDLDERQKIIDLASMLTAPAPRSWTIRWDCGCAVIMPSEVLEHCAIHSAPRPDAAVEARTLWQRLREVMLDADDVDASAVALLTDALARRHLGS